MSTKRNIVMMLSMVSGMASLLPANADCITKTTTYIEPAATMQIVPASKVIVAPTSAVIAPTATILSPSYLAPTALMPAQTVKTTKTTVTTTAPAVVQPTIVSEPETIKRTVIMMGSTPAATSTETMSAAVISPFPVYGNRLAAMNEQIDRSVANGWITAYQADNLRSDSSRLGQMILNRSESKADIDSIERGLTGLNISIQEAMRANGQTAGLTNPTF
jgi:hypothetical protein